MKGAAPGSARTRPAARVVVRFELTGAAAEAWASIPKPVRWKADGPELTLSQLAELVLRQRLAEVAARVAAQREAERVMGDAGGGAGGGERG